MLIATASKKGLCCTRPAWRMAQHAMLAAALLTANTAEAWTLDALLRLPLEHLMELKVTVQRKAMQKPLRVHLPAGKYRMQEVRHAG